MGRGGGVGRFPERKRGAVPRRRRKETHGPSADGNAITRVPSVALEITSWQLSASVKSHDRRGKARHLYFTKRRRTSFIPLSTDICKGPLPFLAQTPTFGEVTRYRSPKASIAKSRKSGNTPGRKMENEKTVSAPGRAERGRVRMEVGPRTLKHGHRHSYSGHSLP